MKNKIISMGQFTNEPQYVSPIECLERVADRLKSGDLKGNKLLIIVLDEEKGRFDIEVSNASMSNSEAIASLEIVKVDFINSMA
jgi:hypothetical protein